MTDVNKGVQRGEGRVGGITHPRKEEEGRNNRGSSFGTREPGTAGTNRDADETGESKNQGHGHPREDRSRRGE